MSLLKFPIVACIALACLVATRAADCRADLVFTVTADTSSLQAANGPYYLDFQLNNGGGIAGGTNTAAITNLTGYQALDTPLPNYGLGVSGGFSSPGDSLILSNQVDPNPPIPGTGGINEYTQGFTPGDSLSFHVEMTTNVGDSFSPDQFLFSLFYTDSTGTPQFIPTTSALGFSFVGVSIDSRSPTIQAFASDGTLSPPGIDVPQPRIEVPVTPVPEPSSIVMVGLGAIGLLGVMRRRHKIA